MEKIVTDKAPKAIGPYSQAVKVGNTLFCSGQIGLDPDTMEMVTWWVEEEVHRVCKNIGAVLEQAWMGCGDVVKTTIFLQNINDFSTVNEIYGTYFPHCPARSTVEVSKLPRGALIEIEVIGIAA